MNQMITQNMEPEVMMERDQRAMIKEVDYARTTQMAREYARNARLAEGPEDDAVMRLSRRVGYMQSQREQGRNLEEYFDPRKMGGADPIKDKLREGLAQDNEALRVAMEAGEFSSPVYKPRPGIMPVKGTATVRVDPNGLSRRRGAPRLGDLVPEAFTQSKENIQ
jgi:hypothetical protein